MLAALLLPNASAQTTAAPMVRFVSPLGPLDIQLDNTAPQTVANFLGYVRRGDYADMFMHRSVPGFVVQGGGFASRAGAAAQIQAIPTQPPVVNEFSATRSNVRGTVAMAKVGGNPNSATNQWFVNLNNNAGPCPGTPQQQGLDCQNGGFTVFGRVTAPSMAVADAIAALRRVNAAGCSPVSLFGALDNLPVVSAVASCPEVVASRLVTMSAVVEMPATQSDSDRIFNYLEAAYPQYAAPASPASATAEGYYYRYYSGTNAYVGTKDGNVYYLVPAISPDIQLLGPVSQWLATAAAAGY
jgi:cyclophilin family peptidyl-prolyl cis-trans isomerase